MQNRNNYCYSDLTLGPAIRYMPQCVARRPQIDLTELRYVLVREGEPVPPFVVSCEEWEKKGAK